MAYVVAVNKSEQRIDPKTDVGEGELRAGHGLVGDAHAGLSEREVSLLALEQIERANRQFGIEAGPGAFAENLTIEGLKLSALQVGQQLRIGPALLEVVQIGKALDVAHTYNFQGVSILPKFGVFCRVLKGGPVSRGEPVEVVKG